MAVFKYGAFITDIAGSVGGTTFKRSPTLPIIQNKNFGPTRNKLFQNKQLSSISQIWSEWTKLTTLEKNNWIYQATLYQFTDKFGNLKNLTGRQLFTKLNIQLLPVNEKVLSTTGMNSNNNVFSILGSWIQGNQSDAGITVITATGSNNYMIQAEVSLRDLQNPTFTRRKVFFFSLASGEEILNITDEFFSEFPYFSNKYTCIFYVTAINNYGFKSITQWDIADIDPD